MNLVDQIAEQASMLPREAQIQVLDFVGYLVGKYTPKSLSEDEAWEQLSAQQAREALGKQPR